jgi:hypothetical protein
MIWQGRYVAALAMALPPPLRAKPTIISKGKGPLR